MGNKRLKKIKFKDFPGTESCLPGSDSVGFSFCLDPDPYQSSVWNRIRNGFFSQILDPDHCQYDPQH